MKYVMGKGWAIILLLLPFRQLPTRQREVRQPSQERRPDQMIIWKDPHATADEFRAWLAEFKDTLRQYGPTTDTNFCPTCDSTLLRLDGPGPEIYMQQQVATGSGGTPTTGVGTKGPAHWCVNISLASPEPAVFVPPTGSQALQLPFNRDSLRPLTPPTSAAAAVTVAVFDTGIDTAMTNTFTLPVAHTCIASPQSRLGWNFAGGDPYTGEEAPLQHGSFVTSFILGQAQAYHPGSVNILPVTVLNSKGEGYLYDFLCGVGYAATAGVKLFNVSLGFYYYSDPVHNQPAVSLMRSYLNYYLARYDILMVAAAGNDNPREDALYAQRKGNQAAGPRDLRANPFYPASFAGDGDSIGHHVLTVTTISFKTGRVSPLQNYGANIVDAGVNCDEVLQEESQNDQHQQLYLFGDPFPPKYMGAATVTFVTGSSFATPIIAGRIAADYVRLVRREKGDRRELKERILYHMGQRVPGPAGSTLYPMLQSKREFDADILKGETANKF